MKLSAQKLARHKAEVKGLLLEVNHEVALLPEGAVRKLLPILHEAERSLERDFTRYLSTVKNGSERFGAQQYRRALFQVRGSLDALKSAGKDMNAALRGASMVAAAASQRHLARELAVFSARFSNSLNPIPLLEAAHVVQGTLLDRFAKISNTWSEGAREEIKKKLALGLVRGESVDQMTRRLMGRVGRRMLGENATPSAEAKFIAQELSSAAKYRMRRIVRTEVINAYNEVKLENLRGLKKYDREMMERWDAALDGRTCQACRDLDHVAIPVGGTFPGGVKGPPLHPNCRCAVVAWRKDWDEAGEVRTASGRAQPDPVRYDRPKRSTRAA